MERDSMNEKVIYTSSKGWLAELATSYRNRQPIILVDDAGAGVDPQRQTLLAMGRQVALPMSSWVAVLISLGMTSFGAWMVVAAVLDPDPTSKLWLLIGSGSVLALSAGMNAVRILTKYTPPKVAVTKKGFQIEWS